MTALASLDALAFLRHAALSASTAALLGVAAWKLVRLGSVGAVRGVLLLALVPGLMLAAGLAWRPDSLGTGAAHGALSAMQGVGLLPLVLLLPNAARARLSPHWKRIAAGLGAGRRAQMRLVWWPAFGPALGAACLLAALGGAGCAGLRAMAQATGGQQAAPPP